MNDKNIKIQSQNISLNLGKSSILSKKDEILAICDTLSVSSKKIQDITKNDNLIKKKFITSQINQDAGVSS